MNVQGLVVHPANRYYVMLREDYLLLAEQCTYKKPVKEGKKKKKSHASAHCKALILAILEHWTDSKRGKGQSLWVIMTYQQFADAMYGLFSRDVIMDSLDELVGEGLIERKTYQHHEKGMYQYLFKYREVNKRLADLPKREPEELAPTGDYDEEKPEQDVVDTTSKNPPTESKNRRTESKNRCGESKNRRFLDSPRYNTDSTQREKPLDTVHPTEGALSPTSPSSSSEASSSSPTPNVSSKRAMTPRFSSKDTAALYRAWVETYGEFGDRRFDLDALEWMAAHGGTIMDIQFIHTRLKRDKQDMLIRPETIKDHWGYLAERKQKQERAAAPPSEKPAVTCMNEAARRRYEQAMQLAQQKG